MNKKGRQTYFEYVEVLYLCWAILLWFACWKDTRCEIPNLLKKRSEVFPIHLPSWFEQLWSYRWVKSISSFFFFLNSQIDRLDMTLNRWRQHVWIYVHVANYQLPEFGDGIAGHKSATKMNLYCSGSHPNTYGACRWSILNTTEIWTTCRPALASNSIVSLGALTRARSNLDRTALHHRGKRKAAAKLARSVTFRSEGIYSWWSTRYICTPYYTQYRWSPTSSC